MQTCAGATEILKRTGKAFHLLVQLLSIWDCLKRQSQIGSIRLLLQKLAGHIAALLDCRERLFHLWGLSWFLLGLCIWHGRSRAGWVRWGVTWNWRCARRSFWATFLGSRLCPAWASSANGTALHHAAWKPFGIFFIMPTDSSKKQLCLHIYIYINKTHTVMIITIFIINHIITITILMSKRHQRIHIACIVGINLHFARGNALALVNIMFTAGKAWSCFDEKLLCNSKFN